MVITVLTIWALSKSPIQQWGKPAFYCTCFHWGGLTSFELHRNKPWNRSQPQMNSKLIIETSTTRIDAQMYTVWLVHSDHHTSSTTNTYDHSCTLINTLLPLHILIIIIKVREESWTKTKSGIKYRGNL